MWYIFKDKQCVASCDFEPNHQDLTTRGEKAVAAKEKIPIDQVELAGLTVRKKQATLAQLKESKKREITAGRNRREQAGFLFKGHWLDADDRSLQRISVVVQAAQAALAAGQPFTVDWNCADNSVITLTAEEIAGIPGALARHFANIHSVAKQLKQQVDAAQTEDELAAIEWPENGEVPE